MHAYDCSRLTRRDISVYHLDIIGNSRLIPPRLREHPQREGGACQKVHGNARKRWACKQARSRVTWAMVRWWCLTSSSRSCVMTHMHHMHPNPSLYMSPSLCALRASLCVCVYVWVGTCVCMCVCACVCVYVCVCV